MSPKDFRKIYYPEPKILNSLVNCGHTHTRTSVNLELTPPEGGSAKNSDHSAQAEPINLD